MMPSTLMSNGVCVGVTSVGKKVGAGVGAGRVAGVVISVTNQYGTWR